MSSLALSPRTRHTKGGVSRRRVWFAAVIGIVAMIAGVFATTPARAEDDNYSFYNLSSAISAYWSKIASPAEQGGEDEGEDIEGQWGEYVLASPANAGAVMGYVDPEGFNPISWIQSAVSGSSQVVGHDALRTLGQNIEGSEDLAPADTSGALHYAQFGSALNAMGFDDTRQSMMSNISSMIGGGLMMGAFALVYAVEMLFSGVIWVLKLINPFQWFYTAVSAITPDAATSLTGDAEGVGAWNPLYGLANFISGWYQTLYDLSWALVIPLMLAGILVTVLILGRTNQLGSKFKRLFVRALFIVLGIPILGSTYTASLNMMSEEISGDDLGASRVIMSTYVDFERWATEYRLAIPEGVNASQGIGWQERRGMIERAGLTPEARSGLRNTALMVNTMGTSGGSNIYGGTAEGNLLGSASVWNQAAAAPGEGAAQQTPSEANSAFDTNTNRMRAWDMLMRYVKDEKVDASAFEGSIKNELSRMTKNGQVDDKTVNKYFTDFGGESIKENPAENPLLAVAPGTGLRKASPGGPNGGNHFYSKDVSGRCGYYVLNSDDSFRSCNMSALAMYNYLNTSFDSDSMTMYSSERASSTGNRELHTAVNQIGGGVDSLLYWANSMALLLTFAVVGIAYALSMIVHNVRSGLRIVVNTPMAILGSMNAISKVIVITLTMIVSTVGTIYLYFFIQQILLSATAIIETPFTKVAQGILGTALTVRFGIPGMLIISTVFLIAIAVLALRFRSSMIRTFDELATKVMDGLLGSQTTPESMSGGGPNRVAEAAKGLGGGAVSMGGALAANKMMGRGGKPGEGGEGSSMFGPSGLGSKPKDGEETPMSKLLGENSAQEGEGEGAGIEGADGSKMSSWATGVDEDGQPVDDEGNPVANAELNPDGTITQPDGSLTDANGNVVGSDEADREAGERVLAEGLSDPDAADAFERHELKEAGELNASDSNLEEDMARGKVLLDKDGNPVLDENGRPVRVDEDGNSLPTADAERVDSADRPDAELATNVHGETTSDAKRVESDSNIPTERDRTDNELRAVDVNDNDGDDDNNRVLATANGVPVPQHGPSTVDGDSGSRGIQSADDGAPVIKESTLRGQDRQGTKDVADEQGPTGIRGHQHVGHDGAPTIGGTQEGTLNSMVRGSGNTQAPITIENQGNHPVETGGPRSHGGGTFIGHENRAARSEAQPVSHVKSEPVQASKPVRPMDVNPASAPLPIHGTTPQQRIQGVRESVERQRMIDQRTMQHKAQVEHARKMMADDSARTRTNKNFAETAKARARRTSSVRAQRTNEAVEKIITVARPEQTEFTWRPPTKKK